MHHSFVSQWEWSLQNVFMEKQMGNCWLSAQLWACEQQSYAQVCVLDSVMGHTVVSEIIYWFDLHAPLHHSELGCGKTALSVVSTCTEEALSHKHSTLLSAWHTEVFPLQPLFQSVVRHQSKLEHWSVPAVGINATLFLEPGGKCKTWDVFESLLSVTSW